MASHECSGPRCRVAHSRDSCPSRVRSLRSRRGVGRRDGDSGTCPSRVLPEPRPRSPSSVLGLEFLESPTPFCDGPGTPRASDFPPCICGNLFHRSLFSPSTTKTLVGPVVLSSPTCVSLPSVQPSRRGPTRPSRLYLPLLTDTPPLRPFPYSLRDPPSRGI